MKIPKIKRQFTFSELEERAKRDLLESSAAVSIFENDDEETIARIAKWYAAGVVRGFEIAFVNIKDWLDERD